jgi:hypothetical protein
MKVAYGILILVFLFSSGLATGQEENISVLDKKITIEVHQETIASVLELISAISQVYFSYDTSLIEAENKVDLLITDQTIRETLNQLFGSKFSIKVLGEQVIIALPGTEEMPEKAPDSANEKSSIIRFKGKILDGEEKTALPYSSISVSDKNLGTISNIDGDFELKIPESMKDDSIVISHLGYRQQRLSIAGVSPDSCIINLQPVSVQLNEIKVSVIDANKIIEKLISKISLNYATEPEIMTAFYREVLQQDGEYIDVAEALLEIRKASYENSFAEDKIKLIKGRKNLNIKPFQIVDFKIQGGPYYATKLDVVKTLDSFLDPESRDQYKYYLAETIEFNNRDTYVIQFKPKEKVENLSYQGKLYIDMSTFAMVHADFSLSRQGLKYAHQLLIKKKPKDFYVRPVNADYSVSYRKVDNTWHLNNAQTSVNFKVKSKNDKVNSTFHSASELLITDFKPDEGEKYKRNELFNSKDIFTEMISSFDEHFWDDFNIIQPSEVLRNALKNYYQKNDTLFHINRK